MQPCKTTKLFRPELSSAICTAGLTSVHPRQHRPCASDHVADTGLLKRHSSKKQQQFTGWV